MEYKKLYLAIRAMRRAGYSPDDTSQMMARIIRGETRAMVSEAAILAAAAIVLSALTVMLAMRYPIAALAFVAAVGVPVRLHILHRCITASEAMKKHHF